MRFRLMLMFLFFTFLGIASTSMQASNSCSCSANDGSCSASISCSGGCICICSSGHCSCDCCPSTSSGGAAATCPVQDTSVKLNVQDLPARQVAQMLAKQTGQKIRIGSGGEKLVTMNLEGGTLWQAIRELREAGVQLLVNRRVISPNPPDRNTIVSFCLTNAKPSNVIARLRQATLDNIIINGEPAADRINLTVKGTFEEALAQLSSAMHVSITLPPGPGKQLAAK